MRTMVLEQVGRALVSRDLADPEPGPGEIRLRVAACGVCRTDLHVVDGELPDVRPPVVPGHEIVGHVDRMGSDVTGFALGQRVGVPWLGWTCGICSYCRAGRENLCDRPQFTGYTRPGGYADLVVADARFAFPLDGPGADADLAPLLCAGLIGWRSLTKAKDAETLAIYGFGAAGHIVLQVARWQGRKVHVLTRPGDREAQDFARALGADWAGDSDALPPEPVDAAIIYAPVGALVPAALRAVRKGGRVVCAGIHMSDIPAFPYAILWEEREVLSVANLTREDAVAFLGIAPEIGIETAISPYPLARANDALDDLRHGRFQGAAVLLPGG